MPMGSATLTKVFLRIHCEALNIPNFLGISVNYCGISFSKVAGQAYFAKQTRESKYP